MAKYTFEQIKIAQNEDLNNPVINRALRRLFENTSSYGSNNLPSSDGVVSPSLLYLSSDGNLPSWQSTTSIANLIPTRPLTAASDTPNNTPQVSGMGLMWDTSTGGSYGSWVYTKLKNKLSDLDDVAINGTPQQYQSLTYYNNKWTNTTQETYLGVGYVKHIVCTQPSIIILPDDMESLNGGEQIEITKIIPSGAPSNYRYPVLIYTGSASNGKFTILNNSYTGIISNNNNEEFSSIHLRVCQTIDANGIPTGGYTWVPVSISGTWLPTSKKTLIEGDINSGADYAIGQYLNNVGKLTSNELRIQPYNLSVNITNQGEISKVFDLVVDINSEPSVSVPKYSMLSSESSNTITLYPDNKNITDDEDNFYISIKHEVSTNRIVKATVYILEKNENDIFGFKEKYTRLPDSNYDVWFNSTGFSNVYLDLFNNTIDAYAYSVSGSPSIKRLKFKIIVSI